MQIIYVPLSYLFDLRCCTHTLYNNEIHLWREKKRGSAKAFLSSLWLYILLLLYLAYVPLCYCY